MTRNAAVRSAVPREWDPKSEAVRTWNADPCGAVGDFPVGSSEFFTAVDRERYGRYAPWLPAAAGFDRFAGCRLLEIGCGMGTDLAQFARGGARVVGLDLTPGHLSIARQRLLLDRGRAPLVQADGELLPFGDASFDAVYSFGVLHHTPRIEAAFDEIWRVLKPGRPAFIAVYHRDSVFYWLSTIFTRGLLFGGLVRQGYRRLVADIERHEHTDALPLVRVFGRRQLERMLRRFTSVTTEVYHLHAADFAHFTPLARRLPSAWMERAARRFGWYLCVRAVK